MLPLFRYHPDPLKTGSIQRSDAQCICCGQVRGYIYTGPVYAADELDEAICPWCIADGSAHEKFDAEFADLAGVGGYGDWVPVPQGIAEEVAFRTPGFHGWQQERWWTHCGDAAAFVGTAGFEEVDRYGAELVQALQGDAQMQGRTWDQYLHALSKDGSPTAYVFRCLHCGKYGGYSDSH